MSTPPSQTSPYGPPIALHDALPIVWRKVATGFCHRGGAAAFPSGADDQLRLHPRASAAGDRGGAGCRQPACRRHAGLLRHAGLDRDRLVHHSDALPRVSVDAREDWRSEEHTSELQSLMRNSYAVFCLKKKKKKENRRSLKSTKQAYNKTKINLVII